MIVREKLFKNFIEQDELMNDKINSGIEMYRKGYFKINFTDSEGNPVNGAKITVRQKKHAFRFGCNIFKLKCFKPEEENRLYEEKFKKLFNMATTPFYWADFEPENGKMRFEKDSVFIDRRIPPELSLEFCRANDIELKGHPLYWQAMVPDWLPGDFEEIKPYLMRRLEAIAERYDGVIKSFDCVNEASYMPMRDDEPGAKSTHYRNFNPLSGDYAEWVFKAADRYFKKSKLVLNETTFPWKHEFKKELSHYYLLAENLIQKGCRIDTIGLQYHNFSSEDTIYELNDFCYNPKHLYKVMDCYGKLGRPLSISEITIPGYDDEIQAETVKNLYRIWFSHKDVESIIYWNLGDNCAISQNDGWAEDKYKSGLVRNDFSEKPSYKVLDNLINHEWKTEFVRETRENHLYFKAFYGDYQVIVERDGKKVTRDLKLSKNGYDEFSFVL